MNRIAAAIVVVLAIITVVSLLFFSELIPLTFITAPCDASHVGDTECDPRGVNNVVFECKWDSINQKYSWMFGRYCTGSTPYCSNGECVSSIPSGCTDTDGGMDYYVKGTASTATETKTDMCLDNKMLREYFCSSDGRILGKEIACPPPNNICSGGRCIEGAVHTCSDTDGGKVYNVKGTVTTEAGSVTDKCLDSNQLEEFYCQNNLMYDDIYTCPYGCSNGACIIQPQCTDTDGGKDYYTAGTVTATDGTATDTCVGATHVKEYYCRSDGTLGAVTFPCTPYSCEEPLFVGGRCKTSGPSPVPPEKCYNPDGEIGDWIPDGYWCSGGDVYGYKCRDGDNPSWTVTKKQDCPYGCSDGACIGQACAGTDTSCGVYPNCVNCNAQDGYSGSNFCYDNDVYRKYKDYYCSGTSCTYTESNAKVQECGDEGCNPSTGACTSVPITNVVIMSFVVISAIVASIAGVLFWKMI